MANFDKFKLTKKGLDLLGQAQTGKKLTFTAVKVGDGESGDTTDVTTFTKLVSPIDADIGIAYHEIIGEGKTQLMTRLNGGSEGFYLREVGIYAKIDNGTEVLYAYTNAHDTADYIPAAGGSTAVVYDLNLITVIGNAQSVAATITAQVGVDYTEYQKHRTSSTMDHPDSSVKTAKIADKAVTTAKVADKAITLAKIDTEVTNIINSKLDKYIVTGVPEITKVVNFDDGDTAFKAIERCALSAEERYLTVTTNATNTGNKYALAHFDFSDIAGNTEKFDIEMDVKIPAKSRWYIAFAELDKRPGTSNRDGYDETGTAFYCGTHYEQMMYVNGQYKLGAEAFDVWVHIHVSMDITSKKVTYTFSNVDTGDVLATETVSFADTAVNKITGIELYSWANGSVLNVDNVSVTAQYVASENALYFVKTNADATAYDMYIYVDGTFVCIAQSVAKNIDDGVVTSAKVSDGAIITAKIANNAVTSDKVLNGAITKEKIASGVLFSGDYDDLTNRPGLVTETSDGLMHSNDKIKLDKIPGTITTVTMNSYTTLDTNSNGGYKLQIACDIDIETDVLKYYEFVDRCNVIEELHETAGGDFQDVILNGVSLTKGNGAGIETELIELTTTHVLHWNGTEWVRVHKNRIHAELTERVVALEARIAALETSLTTTTTEEGE